MGKTIVISVRIPEELKKELEKYKINEAEVIRNALVNEVKKAKAKELEKQINSELLSKISVEDVVKSIREDRDSR
ncbi:CopG family transcriptional regulator [Sulfurisphaera ohwakuensis]|uniref:CopG family transcriptional regulator n=1 Tax=Sulfurisphaera ohwakuensis TaxID=69656 RepID=UPI0036F33210